MTTSLSFHARQPLDTRDRSRPRLALLLLATLLLVVPLASGLLPSAAAATTDDGTRTLGARVGTPEGFAADVTGGAGGDTYWVTSLADSGAGTLRDGLAQNGPTWIRFNVSGTITLHSPLQIPSDTTIDGRDQQVRIAVDRDVTGMTIGNVDNIIIHNLVFIGGQAARNTSGEPRSDAINVFGGDRIWIDHNSMTGWGDKLIGMPVAGDVTVSYNAFHDASPGHAILIGTKSTAGQQANTRVTIHHNTFLNIPDRSPRIGDGGRAHVYNNYVHDWSYYGMKAVRGAQLLAQNNVFGSGNSPKAIAATEGSSAPGDVRADGNLQLNGTRIEQNNRAAVFTPGYGYNLETATTDLRDHLLATAGWTDTNSPESGTPTDDDSSTDPAPDDTTDPSPEPAPEPSPEPSPTSDDTPPVVDPPSVTVPRTGSTVTDTTAVPVNVAWTATDDTGIDHYELEHSIDGSAFTIVPLADPRTSSATVDVAPEREHRFRVTAVDTSDNRAAAVAAPITVALQQEDAEGVSLHDAWWTGTPDAALGGAHAVSRTTGDVATFRFRGDGISWISTERSNRGVAEVRLDGRVVDTVDLYRADPHWRAVVWSASGLDPDVEHTLEVAVTGTRNKAATGGRVDVDAFLVSNATVSTPPTARSSSSRSSTASTAARSPTSRWTRRPRPQRSSSSAPAAHTCSGSGRPTPTATSRRSRPLPRRPRHSTRRTTRPWRSPATGTSGHPAGRSAEATP